ncbi:hypothetical protein [Streptomyces sp. NPDC091278]|uniref:hypothetical protein n=1 Tax=Streptomyces sp. NPDC091278 TaxID=3155301 RepID=UPI00344BBB79
MSNSELVWCEDGPYEGFVDRSEVEEGGYLWFQGGEFSPKPEAWYEKTDRRQPTDQGEAVVFVYIGSEKP